ncbi:hypothetical protein OG196_41300 [Kitasatospora purpeofusca]|uniref:hypothetical protein n=1 Tax=Kitasatospora purpeofusca TaxID=67352 RepID=UPI002E120EB8|nr:hypothetical protein OG196_41300 [Kitasatospora purpeofusca]
MIWGSGGPVRVPDGMFGPRSGPGSGSGLGGRRGRLSVVAEKIVRMNDAANTDTPAVTWTADLPTTVGLVRTLHDLDDCWTLADVERLVGARPDWKIRRAFTDLLVVGLQAELRWPAGAELFLGTTEPKADSYRRAWVPLLQFRLPTPGEERRGALRTLSEALREVGEPTAVPTAADGFGLRWRSAGRTMLLQANDRRAWIAIQPHVREVRHVSPELPAAVAAFVPLLHDAPGGHLAVEEVRRAVEELPGAKGEFGDGWVEVRFSDPSFTPSFARRASVLRDAPEGTFDVLDLHRFDLGPTAMEHRRAVFGEIFGAVRAVLGEPTLFGGGPDGPDVRWREAGEDGRLLRLRCEGRRVRLETEAAPAFEEGEHSTFEWGGPGGADGPSDFPLLPYSWQLHLPHQAPGGTADHLPGGRLALSVPQLREGLECLFAAWIEQLPVQRPGEKAMFTIAAPQISGGLSVTYSTVKGVLLRVGPRPGDQAEVTAAMTADGWEPSGRRFKAEWRTPTEETAREVAALIAAELTARGINGDSGFGLGPGHVTARRPGIGLSPQLAAHGFLRVTGLGLETS